MASGLSVLGAPTALHFLWPPGSESPSDTLQERKKLILIPMRLERSFSSLPCFSSHPWWVGFFVFFFVFPPGSNLLIHSLETKGGFGGPFQVLLSILTRQGVWGKNWTSPEARVGIKERLCARCPYRVFRGEDCFVTVGHLGLLPIT